VTDLVERLDLKTLSALGTTRSTREKSAFFPRQLPENRHSGWFQPGSLSDLLMTTISSSGNFSGMAGICLDQLLKQRSALRKPDFSFDFPPPRGGLRSLSVAADCIATKSQALSGLLS